MNYSLAKELKDAGFESKANFKEYARMYCPHTPEFPESMSHIAHCPDAAYFPHLEELIEACGESFERLERYASKDYGAHGYPSPQGDGSDLEVETGASASEAVAKLWLALHTKANGN